MGRNERILGVQFQGKFGKWVKRAFFARSHVIVQLLSGEQEKRWADTAEVWREQNDKECLVKHSHECNHPHFKILDSRIWGEMTRSSWVSLFVDDLVEFDKYCIRQQDPNIYSDTAQGEVPCLGWRGAVGSFTGNEGEICLTLPQVKPRPLSFQRHCRIRTEYRHTVLQLLKRLYRLSVIPTPFSETCYKMQKKIDPLWSRERE